MQQFQIINSQWIKTSELEHQTYFHIAAVLRRITSVERITTGNLITLRNALIFKIAFFLFTRASILCCLTWLYHVVGVLLASWCQNLLFFWGDISFLNIYFQVHLCPCYRLSQNSLWQLKIKCRILIFKKIIHVQVIWMLL